VHIVNDPLNGQRNGYLITGRVITSSGFPDDRYK